MTQREAAIARAWADLPAQIQAHPGIKALHRAALAALAQPAAPDAQPVTLADVLDALNLFNRPKPSEDEGPWEAGHYIRVDYLPAFINTIAAAWFAPAAAQAAQPAPIPAALVKAMGRACTDPRACTFHRVCMWQCHQPLTNANTALRLRATDTQSAPQPLSEAANAALAEVEKATRKFPTWPTDPLHALAVLGEEFGELTKDVLQMVYEPHKTNRDRIRTECVQTAAMALRFMASLDRYEYRPGEQHSQGGITAAPTTDKKD